MNRFLKFWGKLSDNAYVFSVITKFLSVFLVMIYSVIYSRYMQPELKGVGDVINNYSSTITLVCCLGMYQAYPFFKKTKGKDIYKEFIDLIAGMFLVYLLISALILIVVKPDSDLFIIILLIPIMFAIQEFNYIVLIETPKIRNRTEVLLDCADIVIIALLAIITSANYIVCIGYLVIRQIIRFFAAIVNLRINPLTIRPNLKKAPEYIKYGIVPMCTIIMMEINYKSDVIMMDLMGISNADIGIYSLGVTLAQKVWLIPDALKDILLSKLTNGRDKDEVAKISRLSIAIVLVCILGLIVLGKPIILLLYGNAYSEAYEVILVLLIGVIGMVFYKMIYSFNIVNGHKNINLLLLLVAALVNILMNYIMIPKMGIIGAGIASSASYLLCGICFLVYFCKKNKVKFRSMIFINKTDIKTLMEVIKF